MKRITVVTIAALALLGIVAAGLAAAGCGTSSSGVPSGAVATVGSAGVTSAQLQELLTEAKASATSQGGTFPAKGSAMYDNYVAMAVNYLVQSQLIAQSAASLGVSVTDKEVADQLATLVKANGGEKKVLAILQKQGMTMDLLKRSIKDRLLAQRVSTKVVAGAKVTEAQVQGYWNAHQAVLKKSKKTATYAKAKSIITETVLNAAKQKVWAAWLEQRAKAIGVKFADGYDPAKLTASPVPSASTGG